MIDVVYHREYNRVTVRGHAKSDEYGRDLICAAVSSLALTLKGNLERMAEADIVTAYTARLEEGDAELSCDPRHRYRAVVGQTIQSVCVGFEILAEKYPDYITFRVMG